MKVAPALSQVGAAKVTGRLGQLVVKEIAALKDGVIRRAVMVPPNQSRVGDAMEIAVLSLIRQARAVTATRETPGVAPRVIGPVRKVAGIRAISVGLIWPIAAVVHSRPTASAVEMTVRASLHN